MTEAEKAFYKLLTRLADQGLFRYHPEASDQIVEAFEAAIESHKSKTPAEPVRTLRGTEKTDAL